jgi:hypothetical protein
MLKRAVNGIVPGRAHNFNMEKISLLAFAVCGTAAVAFCFAMLRLELGVTTVRRRLTGDSFLGSQSVNWLGGISFAAALVICCFTK